MTVALVEKHVTRAIRFQEVWETGGWRVKVYGIAYRRPAPRPELVAAAKQIAAQVLPRRADAESRYGVGFLGAHDARGGCYVFVDWWADENELHHHPFLGPSPAELRPARPEESIACLWDLAVVAFEQRAWLDAVLTNSHGPDLERYLAAQLSDAV